MSDAYDSFDVIVVSHFLERDLAPALCQALRPGGLLFYQTFTRDRVSKIGPRRDAYRLARGELWQLFISRGGLWPVVYREEGTIGAAGDLEVSAHRARPGSRAAALRDEALLIAVRVPGDPA